MERLAVDDDALIDEFDNDSGGDEPKWVQEWEEHTKYD
jgi:hypothetical protein